MENVLRGLLLILLFGAMMLPGLSQAAKIYTWTDKNGNKVYSQRPPPASVPHEKKEYKAVSPGSSGHGEPACERRLRVSRARINNNYRAGLRRCNAWLDRSNRSHMSEWRSNCLYDLRQNRSRQLREHYRERRACRAEVARARSKNRPMPVNSKTGRRSAGTCKEKAAEMLKMIESRRRGQEERCAAERKRSGNNVSYGFCMSHARRKYNYSMSKYIDYVGSGCR